MRINCFNKIKNRMMLKNKMIIKNNVLILCLLCLFSAGLGAETISAVLVKDTKLRALPSLKAATTGLLLKNSQVTIISRSGGWYQVKTETDSTAWLSMLRVRFNPRIQVAQKTSNKDFVNLRQGHSNITSTTGVRGIGETDIKNAKPDFIGLKHAQAYRVTIDQSKQFAKQGPLVAQAIDYQESAHE